MLTASEKDAFSKMPYLASRDSSVEPGQQRCCQLETGLSDRVMLVLCGAGILNTLQKTEDRVTFGLGPSASQAGSTLRGHLAEASDAF